MKLASLQRILTLVNPWWFSLALLCGCEHEPFCWETSTCPPTDGGADASSPVATPSTVTSATASTPTTSSTPSTPGDASDTPLVTASPVITRDGQATPPPGLEGGTPGTADVPPVDIPDSGSHTPVDEPGTECMDGASCGAPTCTDGTFDCNGLAQDGCEVVGLPVLPEPVGLRPETGSYSGSWRASTRGTLRPKLEWSPTARGCGPTSYRLQIDDSCAPGEVLTCAFPSPEVAADSQEPSFQPGEDLPVTTTSPGGATYAWRVQACDSGGCSSWSEPRYVNLGRETRDLNGDGFADVVAEVKSGTGWPWDGLAIFAGRENLSELALSHSIDSSMVPKAYWSARFLGDTNGDGFADLVALGYDDYNNANSSYPIGVPYAFYGASSWESVSPTQLGVLDVDRGSIPVFAGDMNGDGFADTVLYDATRGPAALRIIEGSATGPKRTARRSGDIYYWVGRLGDVDGDGKADVGGCSDDGLEVWLGGSAGNLSDLVVDSTLAVNCDGIGAAGDFDANGLDDWYVFRDSDFSLYLNQPSGSPLVWEWKAPAPLASVVATSGLTSNVEKRELLFTFQDSTNRAQVLMSEDPLPGAPQAVYNSSALHGEAQASDLNGNGKNEIIVGTEERFTPDADAWLFWFSPGSVNASANAVARPDGTELFGIAD